MRNALFIRWTLVGISTLALAGCATTTFESSWRNPEAPQLRLGGRKVAAVFVSKDPLHRRRAEDAMAREITARGAQGIAAYTFLSDREIGNRDLARARAEELGFAGAVVMREVGSETQYNYVHTTLVWADPTYRRLWGGYWRWGWDATAGVGRPEPDDQSRRDRQLHLRARRRRDETDDQGRPARARRRRPCWTMRSAGAMCCRRARGYSWPVPSFSARVWCSTWRRLGRASRFLRPSVTAAAQPQVESCTHS